MQVKSIFLNRLRKTIKWRDRVSHFIFICCLRGTQSRGWPWFCDCHACFCVCVCVSVRARSSLRAGFRDGAPTPPIPVTLPRGPFQLHSPIQPQGGPILSTSYPPLPEVRKGRRQMSGRLAFGRWLILPPKRCFRAVGVRLYRRKM